MQSDLLIIYILVALIFLLGGEMFVALWAIMRLTKKIADMKQKEIRQKDELVESSEEMLEETKIKALKIIGQAEIDQQKLEEILESKLKDISAKVAINYAETFNNASKDIEKDLKHHIESLQKLLAEQAEESQRIVDAQIQATRTERLKAIDSEIFNILRSVTQKALGKGLSFEEHQEFIMEALEKAKKENTFK